MDSCAILPLTMRAVVLSVELLEVGAEGLGRNTLHRPSALAMARRIVPKATEKRKVEAIDELQSIVGTKYNRLRRMYVF